MERFVPSSLSANLSNFYSDTGWCIDDQQLYHRPPQNLEHDPSGEPTGRPYLRSFLEWVLRPSSPWSELTFPHSPPSLKLTLTSALPIISRRYLDRFPEKNRDSLSLRTRPRDRRTRVAREWSSRDLAPKSPSCLGKGRFRVDSRGLQELCRGRQGSE